MRVTEYEQHAVRWGCGKMHTAPRPQGARSGRAGYGPNLQAFCVYLMVMHYIPAHRCVALLESLTGAAPSVGFVHGTLTRTSTVLVEMDKRIRALITLAHAVSCDQTPIRVGSKTPRPGRKKAERYLLVACTELYTHYLLGDRDLDTFKASVISELTGSVIVHDRYQNYDSTALGQFTHQLCCQHLCRDLDDSGEVYPGQAWPAQIADALRTLIHHANLARAEEAEHIDDDIREPLIALFRDGVSVGLSANASHGQRPGERKARLPLQVLREREADVLRFAGDLRVPPTSNQAERDLRPAKILQNTSGRLTSEARTTDRYRIRGYLSTAAKHGQTRWTPSAKRCSVDPGYHPTPHPPDQNVARPRRHRKPTITPSARSRLNVYFRSVVSSRERQREGCPRYGAVKLGRTTAGPIVAVAFAFQPLTVIVPCISAWNVQWNL
ncbi:MAG: transposase [Jatrophihabitantaceae bacterium]